ncbi:MAG: ankyrin repeat domain-containing protein [Planctomycetota bacterium]
MITTVEFYRRLRLCLLLVLMGICAVCWMYQHWKKQDDIRKMDRMVTVQKMAEAVKKNDILRLKELIRNNPDLINERDENGFPLLFWAMLADNAEVAELLISQGADLRDKSFGSAMRSAVLSGTRKMVELMIRHGADVNEMDRHGISLANSAAVHYAASTCFVRVMPKIMDEMKVGRENLPRWLQERLTEAESLKSILEFLVSRGARPDVHVALALGMENRKDFMKKSPEALGEEGYRPLHVAIVMEDLDSVQYLLSQNVDVNATSRNGLTPLLMASVQGNRRIVDVLLNHHPKIKAPSGKTTVLHEAVRHGWLDIAERSVNEVVEEVGFKDSAGDTPLHIAVREGNRDMVALLLKNGADKKLCDMQGRTAVKLAKEMKNPAIVGMLEK